MTKAEKTKQYILTESAILFNQKGFAGTSMDDIIERTGLSKGAIYGHFKNKEAIAVASFEHAVGTVTQQVRDRTKVIDNVVDKLKTVVYFYKERILNPPVEGGCPIQNTSIDADDNHPILREKVKEALNAWIDRMVYVLQKGMTKGEVRMDIDAREFATQFIATLEGGIMLAQLYKDVHYFNITSRQLLRMVHDLENQAHISNKENLKQHTQFPPSSSKSLKP